MMIFLVRTKKKSKDLSKEESKKSKNQESKTNQVQVNDKETLSESKKVFRESIVMLMISELLDR